MQLVRYRKIVFRNNAFEAEFKVDGKSVYCNFHVNVGEKEPQLDETDLDYLEMWAYSKPVTETNVMTDKVTLTRQQALDIYESMRSLWNSDPTWDNSGKWIATA